VAALVGVASRTVQDRVGWYRAGGLDEVARQRVGGRRRQLRRPPPPAQEAAPEARASTVGFATRGLGLAWLAEQVGARLTPRQRERAIARLGRRLKVPRPISARADPGRQDAWGRGGSPRR
jgi:transposase